LEKLTEDPEAAAAEAAVQLYKQQFSSVCLQTL